MLSYLKQAGRREPHKALDYWNDLNNKPNVISPVPFNNVAKACLAAQASSALSERLFSDLGKIENNNCQSLLSGSLEMTELVRAFVASELGTSHIIGNS